MAAMLAPFCTWMKQGMGQWCNSSMCAKQIRGRAGKGSQLPPPYVLFPFELQEFITYDRILVHHTWPKLEKKLNSITIGTEMKSCTKTSVQNTI